MIIILALLGKFSIIITSPLLEKPILGLGYYVWITFMTIVNKPWYFDILAQDLGSLK